MMLKEKDTPEGRQKIAFKFQKALNNSKPGEFNDFKIEFFGNEVYILLYGKTT